MSYIQTNNPEFIFKFALTGNSAVGKSSLMQRFCDNFCDESWLPTIGVDFKQKSLSVAGRATKISIWDTAGQERFKTIIRTYYKGCHAVILVFDVTDRQSFVQVEDWLDEVKANGSSPYDKQFLLLIGNKCDLQDQRQVPYQEGLELGEKLGCKYVETSALDGKNVDKAFVELAQDVIEYVEAFKKTREDIDGKKKKKKKIKLGQGQIINEEEKKYSCCNVF